MKRKMAHQPIKWTGRNSVLASLRGWRTLTRRHLAGMQVIPGMPTFLKHWPKGLDDLEAVVCAGPPDLTPKDRDAILQVIVELKAIQAQLLEVMVTR